MSAKNTTLILILGIIVIFAVGCTQPAAVPQTSPVPQALNMTVPFVPIPVQSQNGINLAYEIQFDPAGGQMPVIDRVEVLDPATGKTLYTADGDLLAALYHPASVPPPTPDELQNGTGKLLLPRLSLWFVVSPDTVPDRLTHRFTLNRSATGMPPLTITGADVAVRKDLAPVVIGSPMLGPGWLAMETTSPLTHHFGAQITLNGVTRVPQRFAQDWIYVDPVTGQAAHNNASLARNYYGFGKEIHSVADGTVMAAGDGLPDIDTIFSAPPATVDTAAGNYVIVDIGNRKYACYAHMVNGSVRVKAGDTVKEGQVLGLMGNSGNSDLPHLHFQVVTDTPSFLGAEGYPLVYRSFNVTGTLNVTLATEDRTSPSATELSPSTFQNQFWSNFGRYVIFFQEPVPQTNRLVENNAIVSFP